jgi:hypothetical protein
MVLKISGKTADITLENEKTVGEVLASLEQWLERSGCRLSGLSINGEAVDTSMLEDIFAREIDSVKELDIEVSSLAELAAETLLNLLADVEEFEKLSFDEKNNFLVNWNDSAQAMFTAEQMPDLFSLYVNSFSGGEMDPRVVYSITEERLREVKEPALEFSKLQTLMEETCTRLIDLPLDTQTGKDARAAQTIQIFSGVAEKILRLLRQLDIQGYLTQKPDNEKSFTEIVNEFGNIVKELLEAYERQDSVLVGDLAEYEASVKLQELYTSIQENIKEELAGIK